MGDWDTLAARGVMELQTVSQEDEGQGAQGCGIKRTGELFSVAGPM